MVVVQLLRLVHRLAAQLAWQAIGHGSHGCGTSLAVSPAEADGFAVALPSHARLPVAAVVRLGRTLDEYGNPIVEAPGQASTRR